jgi:hypothetical protein
MKSSRIPRTLELLINQNTGVCLYSISSCFITDLGWVRACVRARDAVGWQCRAVSAGGAPVNSVLTACQPPFSVQLSPI